MSTDSISVRIAVLGILGRSPYGPGSTATFFAGIPSAILLGFVPGLPAFIIVAAVTILACIVSDRAEKELGRHDPNEIVVDELVGFLAATITLPVNAAVLALCFIFFRLFDIWKPWPISLVQSKIKGGLGIVLDDILAGIAANAFCRFILYLWM